MKKGEEEGCRRSLFIKKEDHWICKKCHKSMRREKIMTSLLHHPSQSANGGARLPRGQRVVLKALRRLSKSIARQAKPGADAGYSVRVCCLLAHVTCMPSARLPAITSHAHTYHMHDVHPLCLQQSPTHRPSQVMSPVVVPSCCSHRQPLASHCKLPCGMYACYQSFPFWYLKPFLSISPTHFSLFLFFSIRPRERRMR